MDGDKSAIFARAVSRTLADSGAPKPTQPQAEQGWVNWGNNVNAKIQALETELADTRSAVAEVWQTVEHIYIIMQDQERRLAKASRGAPREIRHLRDGSGQIIGSIALGPEDTEIKRGADD